MKLPSPLAFAAIATFLWAVPAAAQPAPATTHGDPRLEILKAMRTELERNVTGLKMDTYEPPYYLEYVLRDIEEVEIEGRYGAITTLRTLQNRRARAQVRVGSYEFDNTDTSGRDVSFDFSLNYRVDTSAPLENAPLAFRNLFWLITDQEYKSALSAFQKKKGRDVFAVKDPKRPPNFSREAPAQYVGPAIPLAYDKDEWAGIIRRVSGQFKAHPAVFDSNAKFQATKVTTYFTTSEGTGIIEEAVIYSCFVNGAGRAPDGQLLESGRNFYGRSPGELPSEAELAKAASEVVSDILALQNAPILDPYTGPAILEPEAAGVLFHEAVGHRLEGERQNNEQEGRTFQGQVGQPIIPTFLSVFDDPTQAAFEGKKLNGFYHYDEQGVPAQRVVLVEKGILRNYLLSRTPIEGFSKSNGHGRAQGTQRPIARMSNLIVDAHEDVALPDLKKALLDLLKKQKKPFGLLIKDITGGSTNTSTYSYQAFKGSPRMVYRVFPDGREELVRGVELVGTPLSAINRIVKAGKRSSVFNGYCGAESGYVPVSTVAPYLLLEEIELQRRGKDSEKPPLLPSPWAGPEKK